MEKIISKPIKNFALISLGSLLLLFIVAGISTALTSKNNPKKGASIESQQRLSLQYAKEQKKQEGINMIQAAIDPSGFKVTDVDIKDDSISATVDPILGFSYTYQIKESADRLTRLINSKFPGKRITVRLRKNLADGTIRAYGEGYYDGYSTVTTKVY